MKAQEGLIELLYCVVDYNVVVVVFLAIAVVLLFFFYCYCCCCCCLRGDRKELFTFGYFCEFVLSFRMPSNEKDKPNENSETSPGKTDKQTGKNIKGSYGRRQR